MVQATCIEEWPYTEALTRGKKYEVLAEKEDSIRIKGDNGRTKWFPKTSFDLTGKNLPVLQSFKIDDPIHDPRCDCVEVTIRLSTRRRRWCWFVTPKWLQAYFDHTLEPKPINYDGLVMHQITYLGETVTTPSGSRFDAIHVPHMIIVSELTSEAIEATLRHLDRCGELKNATRGLGTRG
jgi:hypothetical protein